MFYSQNGGDIFKMKTRSVSILMITHGFSPNMGGVEVHLDDLLDYLQKKDHKVFVVTYQPITEKLRAPSYERRNENIDIYRMRWFGYNWFNKLDRNLFLLFVYLGPGLLIQSFRVMLLNRNRVDVINSHGLIPAFVSLVLRFFFRKPSVVTVHTVYNLSKPTLVGRILAFILNYHDAVLLCAEGALREMCIQGLDPRKSKVFTYWADQNLFKPLDKAECKRKVGWDDKFVVLFVGRLVRNKGAHILAEVARRVDKTIHFAFIVTGSYEDFLKMTRQTRLRENIIYVGKVDHSILNLYYNAADLLAVPSLHEGFARVNLESMLCGTPVIASSRGALSEVFDSEVSELIEPLSVDLFAQRIQYYYDNRQKLETLSKKCLQYARARFTERNAEDVEAIYLAINRNTSAEKVKSF
jgi:glycosyltransferase involved in cell wall biosynthesis